MLAGNPPGFHRENSGRIAQNPLPSPGMSESYTGFHQRKAVLMTATESSTGRTLSNKFHQENLFPAPRLGEMCAAIPDNQPVARESGSRRGTRLLPARTLGPSGGTQCFWPHIESSGRGRIENDRGHREFHRENPRWQVPAFQWRGIVPANTDPTRCGRFGGRTKVRYGFSWRNE